MEKQKQRRTDISESKVYFNLLGAIGLDACSITYLSKKTKKAKSVIFKQVNLLEERGYLTKLVIENRLVGDEKKYLVNVMSIRKSVFDYLNNKIKLKPQLKKVILTNRYIPYEIIGLMSDLVSKDYTLNKLIGDYFTFPTYQITKCKDRDYILIHKIAREIITSNKVFNNALNNLLPKVKYRFGGEGY